MQNFIIDLFYYICRFENFQSLNLSTNSVLLYSTATQEAVKPVINTFTWAQLPFPLLLTGLLIYGTYISLTAPIVPKPGAHVEPPPEIIIPPLAPPFHIQNFSAIYGPSAPLAPRGPFAEPHWLVKVGEGLQVIGKGLHAIGEGLHTVYCWLVS
jgi:hypothetical protein